MFKFVATRLKSTYVIGRLNVSTYFAPKYLAISYNNAVTETEKVISYPTSTSTSFVNLRWLLNDEIANVVTHIRKLVHAEHPLTEAAKGFLFKKDVPTWSLIVLLVAKCGGLNNTQNVVDVDQTAGILHSQQRLADVTEMIRTSILVHRGILNFNKVTKENHDLHFSNILTLICGDYIISKFVMDLANIRNHDVNYLMSSALRDLTENEFLGERDAQNYPLPSKPHGSQAQAFDLINTADMGPYKVQEILGHSKAEWFLRNILGGANLLGKSCQAVCILTNQETAMQQNAFLFGKHIGLACQIKLEVDMFRRMNLDKYFLCSAPVMWCLGTHPELYEMILKGRKNVDDCDYHKIYEFVRETTSINKCQEVQRKLIKDSLKFLSEFEESPAKQSLIDLLNLLTLD